MISPEGKDESLVSVVPGKQTKFGLGDECRLGCSFAEVLRSAPRYEVLAIGLKGQSLDLFDLLPVLASREMGYGGNEPRSVVDCSELKKPDSKAHWVLPKKKRSLAAVSSKMTKGISVFQWVKQ